MRVIRSLLLTICVCSCPFIVGTAQERAFSVVIKGNLSTAGHVFLNPHATDPVARSQATSITDFFGYGFEVRYHLPGTMLAVGVSTDRIVSRQTTDVRLGAGRTVPEEESYVLIPVELTGYFLIPITDGPFRVYMGGGVGMYYGERRYAFAGASAPSTASTPGFGIHVLGGMQYHFSGAFSLSMELKFRDAQFEGTNAFTAPSARYGATVVTLPSKPFDSSIHTDGMVIQLGAAYSF
jgi:opacity protein-like surface antigen